MAAVLGEGSRHWSRSSFAHGQRRAGRLPVQDRKQQQLASCALPREEQRQGAASALPRLSKPSGSMFAVTRPLLREGKQQSPRRTSFAESPTPSKRPTSRSRSRRRSRPCCRNGTNWSVSRRKAPGGRRRSQPFRTGTAADGGAAVTSAMAASRLLVGGVASTGSACVVVLMLQIGLRRPRPAWSALQVFQANALHDRQFQSRAARRSLAAGRRSLDRHRRGCSQRLVPIAAALAGAGISAD